MTGLASSRSASSAALIRADGSSGASSSKRNDRPARTCADTVEPERGQRPLDRRALRVGDAGAQLHLDLGPEPHVVAPYQSS